MNGSTIQFSRAFRRNSDRAVRLPAPTLGSGKYKEMGMTWLEWIKNMKGEDLLIGGLGLFGLVVFACCAAIIIVRGNRVTVYRKDDKSPWD